MRVLTVAVEGMIEAWSELTWAEQCWTKSFAISFPGEDSQVGFISQMLRSYELD